MKETKFKGLLQSIDQAREIRSGKKAASRIFHFSPVRVKEIRVKLGLTQQQFADMIYISLGTLRNWEQGRTYPDGPAIALLRIVEAKPKETLEALHFKKAA